MQDNSLPSEAAALPQETAGQQAGAEQVVRDVLSDVLGISRERSEAFTRDTPLFGHLPELDSMAVAGLLTEMEDRLDILIDDEEVDAEIFDTFGNLADFIAMKMAG